MIGELMQFLQAKAPLHGRMDARLTAMRRTRQVAKQRALTAPDLNEAGMAGANVPRRERPFQRLLRDPGQCFGV